MGDFDVKNFSYTYILFKGSHCMDSKIIEHGIILLYKGKVEQAESLGCYSLLLLTSCKNIWSENLHFPSTLSYLFHSYDIVSLENIHQSHFESLQSSPNQSVLKNINMFFEEHENMQPFLESFCKAFIKLL